MTFKQTNIFIILFFCLTSVGQPSDSLNFKDRNGKKQGYWIITRKEKFNADSCYEVGQKIEEGYYLNSRKHGIWTEYYCNGKLKNILTFSGGRPNGAAKLFYDNGNIKEQGTWIANRWVGIYKAFDINGKLIDEQDFGEIGKTDSSHIKAWPPSALNPYEDLNGEHTLYNKYKQIAKQGIFKDNRLIDGKHFIYDDDHILIKVNLYKDGTFQRDSIIH